MQKLGYMYAKILHDIFSIKCTTAAVIFECYGETLSGFRNEEVLVYEFLWEWHWWG